MRNTATILLTSLCFLISLPVLALDNESLTKTGADEYSFVGETHQTVPLYLADSEQDRKSQPESGTLVIPGEEQDKKQKQCLNVCKKWGEDCIINPRTGTRNCRRTCKQFGEECF